MLPRFISSVVRGKNLAPLNGKKSLFLKKATKDVHPKFPARTRFAPSPTGFLHIGSLRTALYNYLLAKNTGGQFLLRLEDTDQKRLVEGAEESLYESLKWLGINYDEGPGVNEVYGPYRQSDRSKVYQEHINKLIESGHAYRCFCSKDRLDSLRFSAQKLQPPTTVSYDRHCLHLSPDEVNSRLNSNVPFTVRFKSPTKYPPFEDLLHGKLNMQPQINFHDVRYEDPILMKSDGLPTYHFANVVDDHLMKITHVIRGEEWLPSTPKHIALYEAFGWEPPSYIHIPLLTSSTDKKLSKRKGDSDIRAMKSKGILPEALINFSALFGWAPPRNLASKNHECFKLDELVDIFNINHLTKGNAKVDDKKLYFFNKHYLSLRLANPTEFSRISNELFAFMKPRYPNLEVSDVTNVLKAVGKYLTTVPEFEPLFYYLFKIPDYSNKHAVQYLDTIDKYTTKNVLEYFNGKIEADNLNLLINQAAIHFSLPKKVIFETVRFALSGSVPGLKLQLLVDLLGSTECNKRIQSALCIV